MKLAAIVALALLVVVGAQQPFPCQDFTVPPPPKTIHDLHPAHVSIVLAMGDSITAAFAARGTLMESRDISWSAGVGTPTQLTMPYMINQYAAKAGTVLEGMSVRRGFFNSAALVILDNNFSSMLASACTSSDRERAAQ
jgi:hypothetical protein